MYNKPLTVNDIHKIQYETQKNMMISYNTNLMRCYEIIKNAVKLNKLYTAYKVPSFIFGCPTYNLGKCINYMYIHLKKNGYTVKYIFPNILVIIWSYNPVNKTIEDIKVEQKPNYNSTMMYKNPIDNFLFKR